MGALNDWGVPQDGPTRYETCFVPGSTGPWVPRVLALARPQPGEHVLDVACGTGVVARAAAALVGPHGRVVGCDHALAVLEFARERAVRRADAAAVEWREGDAGSLPFADESFDVVCCQLGLMFFPDRLGALREMRRVLRPGGRLAVMTWGAIERCPGQAVMKATWTRHFGADKATLFDGQHALSDPDEVLALLRDADFRDATVQAAMGIARFASPEQLTGAYGTSLGVHADAPTRARIIAEVRDALREYIGADGLAYPVEAILGSARR